MDDIDINKFPEFEGRTPNEVNKDKIVQDFKELFAESIEDGISIRCRHCGTGISIEYQGSIKGTIEKLTEKTTLGEKLAVVVENTPTGWFDIPGILAKTFRIRNDEGRLKIYNAHLVNEENNQIRCESCGELYSQEELFKKWIDEEIPIVSKREAEEYFDDL